MDLYTCDSWLNPLIPLDQDEWISAIWTERYSTAGDCQLVLPATPYYMDLLKEKTFLGMRGSEEIMILETQNVEDGLLTVKGTDLLGFFKQRWAWFVNLGSSDENDRVQDYVITTMKPVEAIVHVVTIMVGTAEDFTFPPGSLGLAALDRSQEYLPITTTSWSDVGEVKRLTFPNGPLYDSIVQVAEKENVGIKLVLNNPGVDGFPPNLYFAAYVGADHTSAQTDNALIRLSPQLESISDIKEVRSIAEYKNVCYVYYKGELTKHLADPSAPEPVGFDRRVLLTNAEGEPVGRKPSNMGRWVGGDYNYAPEPGPADIAAFREQNAKDALANHNYIRAMDGETSLNVQYKFGEDYGLGDIIELESPSGMIQKARVTEHIRSSDKLGKRDYPTISVIS